MNKILLYELNHNSLSGSSEVMSEQINELKTNEAYESQHLTAERLAHTLLIMYGLNKIRSFPQYTLMAKLNVHIIACYLNELQLEYLLTLSHFGQNVLGLSYALFLSCGFPMTSTHRAETDSTMHVGNREEIKKQVLVIPYFIKIRHDSNLRIFNYLKHN